LIRTHWKILAQGGGYREFGNAERKQLKKKEEENKQTRKKRKQIMKLQVLDAISKY
jgi:hypothetical protein